MIALDMWVTQTKRHGHWFRGNGLIKVDAALAAYWAAVRKQKQQEKLVACLSNLISACRKWLIDMKASPHATKPLNQDRIWHVKQLGEQAVAELIRLRPALRAEISFAKAKLYTQLRTEPRFQFKPLAPGYSHERSLYLQSGKTYAPSGSDLHQVLGFHTKGGLFTDRDNQHLASAKTKTFENLTVQEFQALHELGKEEGFGQQVEFLKKGVRMQFLAVPEGGDLIDTTGTRMNAPRPNAVFLQCMYAIDNYGNLLVKEPGVIHPRDNVANFNHSSFNAGKDVICAGMIVVRNGVLLQIDNNSGHYKPTRVNLHEAVRLLSEEDLFLAHTAVLVYEFVGTVQEVSVYHANTFLHNSDAEPDIGTLADQSEIDAFLERL